MVYYNKIDKISPVCKSGPQHSLCGCHATADSISVPLDKALERLRNDSTGRSSIAILSGAIIVPIYLWMNNQFTIPILIVFTLIVVIAVSVCGAKIKAARLALRRCDHDKNELILTKSGICIPIILFPWFDLLNEKINNYHNSGVFILWKDLACWRVLSGRGGNYYYLMLKENNCLFPKKISIRISSEDFSRDQQTSILCFAQRFLVQPVQF